MATSSSRNFVTTQDEIIDEALRIVGAANMGSTALAKAKANAERTLNIFVKSLSTKGLLELWTWVERTTLYNTSTDASQSVVTSGTQSYNLGTDVLEVMADTVFVRRSGADTLLKPMNWREWALEGDKDQSGQPNRFLVKYTSFTDSTSNRVIQGRLQLLLHPVPNNSTDIIGYTAKVKLQDFDGPANDPDAPVPWMRCLIYGLASELAIQYQLPMDDRRDIRREYEKELKEIREHDTPRGSMRLNPILPFVWRY